MIECRGIGAFEWSLSEWAISGLDLLRWAGLAGLVNSFWCADLAGYWGLVFTTAVVITNEWQVFVA